MINLIKNELIKIFNKQILVVIFILFITVNLIIIVVGTLLARKGEGFSGSNNLEQNLQELKTAIKEDEEYFKLNKEQYGVTVENYRNIDDKKFDYYSKKEFEKRIEEYEIRKYKLEKNINDGSLTEMIKALQIMRTITIVIIVVELAGTILCDEIFSRTIKLLLVRPFKRWQILLAKIIAIIIISIISSILLFIIQTFMFGFLCGFKIDPVYVYNFNTNTVVEMNIIKYLIITMSCNIPMISILGLIALAVSFTSLSTTGGNTAAFIVYMMSGLIRFFTMQVPDNAKLKFIPVLNWTFQQFLYGKLPNYNGLTIQISIIMCISIIAFLSWFTFYKFNKFEVTNVG